MEQLSAYRSTTNLSVCEHCGLSLGAAEFARGERFCCSGCEFVFSIIQDNGLNQYYTIRDKLDAPNIAVDPKKIRNRLLNGNKEL